MTADPLGDAVRAAFIATMRRRGGFFPGDDEHDVAADMTAALRLSGVTVATPPAEGLDVERIKREERMWGARCTGCSSVRTACDRYRAEQRACCPDCEHISLFVVEPTFARAYAATPQPAEEEACCCKGAERCGHSCAYCESQPIVAAQPAPDALRAAAQAVWVAAGGHGECTCVPRPIGDGRVYHFSDCDHDDDLRGALDSLRAALTEPTGGAG